MYKPAIEYHINDNALNIHVYINVVFLPNSSANRKLIKAPIKKQIEHQTSISIINQVTEHKNYQIVLPNKIT